MLKNGKEILDESLVGRFVNGDMKAFDNIYSFFSPKLRKFIYSLIKSRTDTEDLVHEVFVKVWENKDKLKKYTSLDSYLFTIAYNSTITQLRERSKKLQYVEYVKSVQIEFDETDLMEDFSGEELHEKLNQLIANMPPRQQEIFRLKHFQKYSYKQIAESMNISINTVESQMVKAHKYLKESLGKTYFSILLFIHLFL